MTSQKYKKEGFVKSSRIKAHLIYGVAAVREPPLQYRCAAAMKLEHDPAPGRTDGLFTKPSRLDDNLNGSILSFREGMKCFLVSF